MERKNIELGYGEIVFINKKKLGAIASSDSKVFHFTGLDLEDEVKRDDKVTFQVREQNINRGEEELRFFATKIRRV